MSTVIKSVIAVDTNGQIFIVEFYKTYVTVLETNYLARGIAMATVNCKYFILAGDESHVVIMNGLTGEVAEHNISLCGV